MRSLEKARRSRMAEIAEQIFDLPVRRAVPTGVGGMVDHVSSPGYATPVGLLLYAHHNTVPAESDGFFTKVFGLFKEFF